MCPARCASIPPSRGSQAADHATFGVLAEGVNRPLTVVYAFLDFSDGGAQRLALATWHNLDSRRFQPRLLCVRSSGSLSHAAREMGVSVHVLGRLEEPYDVGAVIRIAQWLRAIEATIVHVPLYSRVSPYVRLAARVARTPLVVAHEHCRARSPSLKRQLVDRLLARGTRFIAVSEAQRAQLLQAGTRSSVVAVVRNGVDIDRFVPRDVAGARAELGLDADSPIILVPARLVARKGHPDLIAALPHVAQSIGDVEVLCAGSGPLREVLSALASSAGMSAHVRFLGHREDMPVLMSAADVICLPSLIEGMPLAVLEAMACARPVVATSVDGVPEVIDDGITGRLVPPRDPRRLARALTEFLADQTKRRLAGEAARRVAVERHSDEAMTRQLEAVYESWLAELLAGRTRTRREAECE